MKNVERAIRMAIFVLSIIALWCFVAVVLWWAYDIRAFIDGGAYSQEAALTWVREFAAIISVIVGLVWAISIAREEVLGLPARALGWTVLWRTAAALVTYAAIIIARRYTWNEGRGQSDWAMFFGRVNARAFSETGPLSFLLEVLPAASVISVLLLVLQAALSRRLTRLPDKTAVANR
jgi:hypothetical protein